MPCCQQQPPAPMNAAIEGLLTEGAMQAAGGRLSGGPPAGHPASMAHSTAQQHRSTAHRTTAQHSTHLVGLWRGGRHMQALPQRPHQVHNLWRALPAPGAMPRVHFEQKHAKRVDVDGLVVVGRGGEGRGCANGRSLLACSLQQWVGRGWEGVHSAVGAVTWVGGMGLFSTAICLVVALSGSGWQWVLGGQGAAATSPTHPHAHPPPTHRKAPLTLETTPSVIASWGMWDTVPTVADRMGSSPSTLDRPKSHTWAGQGRAGCSVAWRGLCARVLRLGWAGGVQAG